ncbi:hypothetical protein HaLaN_17835 [Haematococcus lacustris]|uniref:Uncharacterized protein n=1 Tax=Haematococcus lacustris TaxID=44745 RepID=A0A699ZFH9_HAELA|nr:hypothetical protein HaLaN_17835 [Haematococcus lacustris]
MIDVGRQENRLASPQRAVAHLMLRLEVEVEDDSHGDLASVDNLCVKCSCKTAAIPSPTSKLLWQSLVLITIIQLLRVLQTPPGIAWFNSGGGGHPRHWPRNSLFGTVFDPLHVILLPLGSTSHSGVASRRDELLAGGISAPSSLCCRRTGNCEDQHQTHSSPRVFQAGVQQGNQLLKTVSKRMPINHPHLHHRARQQRRRAAAERTI